MKSKKFHSPMPLKNSKLLISLTSALTAVLLTTVPVQAEEAKNFSNSNDMFITESADTYLNFNDKQGSDGLDWTWRHQGVLSGVVKCPSNSVKNCPAFPFAGINFFVYSSVQNVFSVTSLNDFYDVAKKQVMRFEIKNPSSFVKNNKKKFSLVLPNITLKPGEYAVASLIALDKWIPLGRGGMKKGMFSVVDSTNSTAYKKTFNFDGQIGTWEGHAFRGHRVHVCVDKIGRVPKMNEEVTCNAPAKIPKGIAP
jgi:hypothetical protein